MENSMKIIIFFVEPFPNKNLLIVLFWNNMLSIQPFSLNVLALWLHAYLLQGQLIPPQKTKLYLFAENVDAALRNI